MTIISRFGLCGLARAPHRFVLPLLVAVLALGSGAARATPVFSYTATVEGTANPSAGLTVTNYTPPGTGTGSIGFGDGTVATFANPSASAYPAMAVNGSLAGLYAAPVDAGGSAIATNYYSTGLGTVTFQLASPQSYFGLLWGSADIGNTLAFYSGGTLVGAITTADFDAAANGSQGFGGSYFINANLSGGAFDEVIASSSFNSFEFGDVVAGAAPASVPEPASAALLAAGLLGCAVLRRRAPALSRAV